MKKRILSLAKLLLGIGLGYALSHHFSHPDGRARKHVPLIRVKNIQITPNLLIATKNKNWHIHHWTYLPIFYIPLLAILRPLLKKHWLHGFVLGGIVHGLTFKDRFTFGKK